MRTKLLYLAAALLAVACSPKSSDTTKVVGRFAGNAPETVRLVRGYYDGLLDEDQFVSFFDTTVAVVNGRFEVEIPKCTSTTTEFQNGSDVVNFISDGSTITIDPEGHTAVSSNEDGPHSRYLDFANRWNDYQTKIASFGADTEARDENIGTFMEYTKEVARRNSDNFLGLQALELLYFTSMGEQRAMDAEEMLTLLDGLSDEMKTSPMSSLMYNELLNIYSGLANATEGMPFVDFTVVQDPENPEASTVRLSDYVGKGKYVLVDFWASWCGPCKAEMPYLISVYNTYHGDRFDMLSVAVADKVEDTVKAAKELGIVWNQIVNAQQIPGKAYGFDAIPLTILFGPDGTILKRDLRGEKVGEAVKEALGL
ncbi:MAG: TlpA family protein disulfide reductase [Bacteroidales bacterium]|nr:TlpA family protein disulfide reductase [Bacteroidales bacterium]